jgi:hypothetical protein
MLLTQNNNIVNLKFYTVLIGLLAISFASYGQCPNNDNTDSDGDGVADCIDPCIDIANSIAGNLSFESDFIGWTIPQNSANFNTSTEASNVLHGNKSMVVAAPSASTFENYALETEQFILEPNVAYNLRIPVKRLSTNDGDAIRWVLIDSDGIYRHFNNYYNTVEDWNYITINNLFINFDFYTNDIFRLRLEFGLSTVDMAVDKIELYKAEQGADPAYQDLDGDGLPDCDTVDVLQSEREALIAFYNATGGDNWVNNTNWNTSAPVRTWFGITTSTTDIFGQTYTDGLEHVQSLSFLQFNNIAGSLPSELANLTKLAGMNFINNPLNGTIPDYIYDYPQLVFFRIQNSEMSGTISPNIQNATNLRSLLIDGNNFSGPIPDLTNLPSFDRFLFIQNNAFQFGDFENQFSTYQSTIDNFSYTPQKPLSPKPNIIASNGDIISIPAEISGSQNNYEWYKRTSVFGIDLVSTEETLDFVFDDASEGTYFLSVTSNLVPNLMLTTPDFSIGQDPTTSPDYATLIDFYNSTGGPNWTDAATNNWNTNTPLSTWSGVTLNENGNVTSIIRFSNGLEGSIPSSMTNLEQLESINISGNNLSADIPDFGSMANIESLDLVRNDFSIADFETNFESNSTISNFRFAFQNLRDAPIEIEPITGEDYEFSMSEVAGTDVQYQWYREIPFLIGTDALGDLVTDASSNTISFTNFEADDFSTYFCAATSSLIPDLVIRRETIKLNGPVSQQEKDALAAFYNALDGDNWGDGVNTNWLSDVPVREWANVVVTGNKVTALNFFGGNLVGELPEELGNLSNLVYLEFSIVPNLTGSLPESFTGLSNLQRIRIQGAGMTGAVLPEDIGNLIKLKEILIVFSGFTGTIPSSIGNLSDLLRLDMNGNVLGINPPNTLSGTLPSSLGNLSNLGTLRLDANNLEGQIPESLSNIGSNFGLNINLANNNFSGPLPDWGTNLTIPETSTIQINGNQFNFDDLEPLVNSGTEFLFFEYSPQRTQDVEENITTGIGATLTLNVNDTDIDRDSNDTAINNNYQWYKDEVAITGANATDYIITNTQTTDSGVYYCEITNPILPDLTIVRAPITLNIDPSLGSIDNEVNAILIYPNPTKNWLNIKTYNLIDTEASIYDINGRLVLTKTLNGNLNVLNVEQLQSGAYILKIEAQNKIQTQRFIKQ